MSLRTNSVKQFYFDLTMRMFVKQRMLLLRIFGKRLNMRWKFSKIMLRMRILTMPRSYLTPLWRKLITVTK